MALIRKLSRTSAIRLMRFSGGIAYLVAVGERKKTIRHLKMAFGDDKSDAEIKLIARKVFIHLGIAAADMIRLPIYIKKGVLNRLVTAEGFHHIETALSKGKGVIVLTGHFGNWELGGAWLAQNEIPVTVVGTPLYDPRLDAIIVNGRNHAGYKNIARSKGTRDIIRSLRKNFALALLIDLDTKVEGVFVNFFDHPAHTATGPVILSQKYGSPIVPVFIHMRDDLTYCVSFSKELDLVSTENKEQDLITNVQKCSDEYEKVIRQYPEQWIWMHELWKKQPEICQRGIFASGQT
ncbi:MAG: lysophospholipid acyltransferase family protein [Desulfobacterales bacterium]|nr:lysophospholipid acyltransferase family protein [Desulfobacterales bacterium]